MSKRLRQIMVKNVITVEPNATVKNAVELMNTHKITCLVVVNHEKPIGIVTEQDMVRRVMHKSKSPENTRVSDIMSKPLIVATPNMQIREASKLMLQRHIRRLPIVENEQLIGLVTLTDLIDASIPHKMLRKTRLLTPQKMKTRTH
jgi:CBS domain-containing protein